MSDVLERILAYKRAEAAARREAAPRLDDQIATAPAPRGFAAAIAAARAAGRCALIAEIKKASPSKGLIRPDFDPSALAQGYAAGGADCLSVLTDGPSFHGAEAHLIAARSACSLPILRKDFLVDPWQVGESRALGADAVLIILAAVDDGLASALLGEARRFGMDALVECHDAAEIGRALALDADLIGVNNRSLRNFETRLETFEALGPMIGTDRLAIAESGIGSPLDVARVRAAGAAGVLVGEFLMRQSDVAAAARALMAPA
jgi:indole-3-glycerol phosphate synthase